MPINENAETVLSGGAMNAPVRSGNQVRRAARESSATIHRLLRHARDRGIDWVPEPIFLDAGWEIVSFIEGEVPHEMPDWVWSTETLREVARRIRRWHDATADFPREGAVWGFSNGEADEVICHNDFAPYNCVFRDRSFAGLIDFDLCCPGTRLWDLAYTAYRFIPIMPHEPVGYGPEGEEPERSPFELDETLRRVDDFLAAYSGGDAAVSYSRAELLAKTAVRLDVVAKWTADFAERAGNERLRANACMYSAHAGWVRDLAMPRRG